MSLDPASLPDSFRRAQTRESALKQPCGRCPACKGKKPLQCVQLNRPTGLGAQNAPPCATIAPGLRGEGIEAPSSTPPAPTEGVASRKGVSFVILGQPVGKPRQTQSDKWKKRPCVVRYRAWADRARAAAPVLPDNPRAIECVAYIAMPRSWSLKECNRNYGQLHRQKPDADNILKACCDALFKNDAGIAEMRVVKRWATTEESRIYVTVR